MPRGIRPAALALLLLLLVSSVGTAQVAIGLTGGVNSSTLNGSASDTLDVSSGTGGAGGGYVNIYLGSKWSVEGQLLFAGQTFDVSSTSFTQGYLEIPALLKFYIGHLNLFAGPAISWQVSCSTDLTTTTCDQAANSLWSGIAGAGLQFGKLGIEAHYQTGFSDAIENVDASYGAWYVMARLAILGSR
jgi:hypothetical protein